ncbi:MAG: diacylglyceryl transferase [Flavobacteriales bacterium]|nr:diacylglyceryl transferase [Flavobacteriales bacterium]|tara:strand:+ start:6819 stop:7121 length:303 start_codon:yes stop_codon:yes gene_type:complete
MKKIKEKWGIKSNLQLIIIFVVFGITGSLSLYVSAPILDFVGLRKENLSPWIYQPLKLILIFPAYQVLILIVGAVFGQFKFFWQFEKKMLFRLGFKQFKD